jgi:hypothetical protein
MSKPVRILIGAYVAIAIVTFALQIPIRLHYCEGLRACGESLLKAPLWAIVWPLYWPAFLGMFR